MEEEMSYEAAYNELAEIASAIENETVTVDVLADRVKRASELISYCQNTLRSTETEVNKIIKHLEDPEQSNSL